MFVGLGGICAALAYEFGLRDPVFGGCMPTGFAAVRGVPGVDLYPGTPSIFRFGAQTWRGVNPAVARSDCTESWGFQRSTP